MMALTDTNVVLDMLGKREPWYRAASDILFLGAQGKCHLALSASTVTDIYYLVQRHLCHDQSKSLDIITRLLEFFSVVEVGFEDCCLALTSRVKDYEDAVLVEAARRAKVDCIITRNTKDFEAASLKIFTPDEFLDQLLNHNQS
jgi:predicted nucleic acid-binding protein